MGSDLFVIRPPANRLPEVYDVIGIAIDPPDDHDGWQSSRQGEAALFHQAGTWTAMCQRGDHIMVSIGIDDDDALLQLTDLVRENYP